MIIIEFKYWDSSCCLRAEVRVALYTWVPFY